MADISKIYGTLAKRIVGVLVALIIIPLTIDAILLIRRDRLIKTQAAENQLLLMEENFKIYLNQFVDLHLAELEKEASGEYVLDSTLKVVQTPTTEMKGKSDFFQPELKKIFSEGKGIFLGLNPYTGVDELFVFIRKGEELRGISTTETRFLKPYQNFHPFIFSLVTNGSIEPGAMSKTSPVADSNFALRVTLPYEAIAQFKGGAIYSHLFWLLGSILIIGGLGTSWLVQKMAKPMRQLSSVMEAVAGRDYSPRYRVQPFGFEINSLGTHFNGMLESLLAHMKEAKNERVRRELLSQELRIGQEIQLQLLPKEIPKFPGIQMGSRFQSAKEVAGDFFDVFPLSEETFFFVIADGSDKGISACLYSLIVRSMLRSHTLAKESLSSIVKLTNNLFLRDTQDTGNFVTAWLGIFDAKTDKVTYTSAGHLPALLLGPNGEIEELSTPGIALGVSEVDRVEIRQSSFPSGSQLFLYTDGLTDTQNEKGELFGKSRLFSFLKTSSQLEPVRLIDDLMSEIETFSSGSEPYDDLTILSFKKA